MTCVPRKSIISASVNPFTRMILVAVLDALGDNSQVDHPPRSPKRLHPVCSKTRLGLLQLRKVSIYAVKSPPLLRLQIGLLTPALFCELIKFLAFQRGLHGGRWLLGPARRHFRGRFKKFQILHSASSPATFAATAASKMLPEIKYPLASWSQKPERCDCQHSLMILHSMSCYHRPGN